MPQGTRRRPHSQIVMARFSQAIHVCLLSWPHRWKGQDVDARLRGHDERVCGCSLKLPRGGRKRMTDKTPVRGEQPETSLLRLGEQQFVEGSLWSNGVVSARAAWPAVMGRNVTS